jgi:hypothetical protein
MQPIPEESSDSTEEEESAPEVEAPAELQAVSASLPFDPAIYSNSKVGPRCTVREMP